MSRTITNRSNTYAIANALLNDSSRVDVSASDPPSLGQTLVATSSTAATWQAPSTTFSTLKDSALTPYCFVTADNTGTLTSMPLAAAANEVLVMGSNSQANV